MTQGQNGRAPTQPEDYRAILGTVCLVNWLAIGLALIIELYIQASDALVWPTWGYFTLSYNLVLTEFALVTAGVTILLRRTAWLDRAPRAALDRLHYLLLAVLALDGIHLVGLFHLTGGLHSPILILLLPTLLSLYLLLPRREAHLVTVLFGLALLLTGLLNVDREGMLADAFRPEGAALIPWLLIVVPAVLLALLVGQSANRQFEKHGGGLGHVVERDPDTQLFTRAVLEHRVPGELGRLDRADSAAAMIMISFRNIENLFSRGDYALFDKVLHEFANELRRCTRGSSDTCARYDVTSFAALLPTASAETVTEIVARIQKGTEAILPQWDGRPGVEIAIGAVCTTTASHTEPATFLNAAKEALQEALSGEPGHQLVLKNL